MSPKTATISLVLLPLTLTLTLSSAHDQCPDSSISKILTRYDLPPSIYPDDVLSISCDLITEDSLRLTIYLEGDCVVTRELWGVTIVLTFKQEISAILSNRKLAEVKGVTVQIIPITDLITVTGDEVTEDYFGNKYIQFNSDNTRSPPIPLVVFPPKPPKCDSTAAAVLPLISTLLVA